MVVRETGQDLPVVGKGVIILQVHEGPGIDGTVAGIAEINAIGAGGNSLFPGMIGPGEGEILKADF